MDAKMDQRVSEGNVWRGFMWGGLGLVLSMPALAMMAGAEGVDWTPSDFVIMGGLMLLLGSVIEVTVRLFVSWRTRVAAILGAVSVFLTIWVELAVGIFATPFAGS